MSAVTKEQTRAELLARILDHDKAIADIEYELLAGSNKRGPVWRVNAAMAAKHYRLERIELIRELAACGASTKELLTVLA
jgi:hypothetical protein